MSRHDQPIQDISIAMMRRVLDAECARRMIKRNGIEGEALARGIMNAFISGLVDEGG